MKELQNLQQQAQKLVAQMTLKEKVKLMAANETMLSWIIGMATKARYNETPYEAGGCERLGIPKLRFCDGPRGVCSGKSTCFPVSMARGATFNPALEEQVGKAIGEEVRAHGANFFAGICLNVPYHPGDGRSQETYSEDSYHIGEMGAALVRGVQSQNVAACIKHYAFNSMECSRFKVNVTADKRTEREVYLPHFKRCLDEGAYSLMSSYNKYQGEWCGHHKYLLRDVAKGEWGFDGPVMSDFLLGVRDTAGGISGGLDIEMRCRRYYFYGKIKKALKSGSITMEMIDEAAVRIVKMFLKLQAAPDPREYPRSLIACKEHTDLARKVAEESITLLKNEQLLPLPAEDITLALIGDLADVANIGDHGSSQVTPPYVVTLKQAIEKNYPSICLVWVPTEDVERQTEVIRNADAAVIVCGCRDCDEGEFMPQRKTDRGGDRESLHLHAPDLKMIDTVSKLNEKTAVVLMGGNVLMVHDWKDKVRAILDAYYPGMEGGNALADILFGKVNPSGKLPFAIAAEESAYPEIVWDTEHQEYGYYHGYQKLDKDGAETDYPFGYGLSYTTFDLSEICLVSVDAKQATFNVTVKNTGSTPGAEVVQLYIGYEGSEVDRPHRTLRDFQKVFLQPGETANVTLRVSKESLAWYSEQKNGWVEENIDYICCIGTDEQSCSNNHIQFRFSENEIPYK